MNFLTDEKLLIVGAAGMIGSNMAQTALMLGLTPNICLYDIFEPGVHGVAEEMRHCGFEDANITWTTDPETAFTDAKYIVSSGGAPRKEGMTREDLLKGNCQIAAQFGDYIKQYCPDVKHVVVIFNPADVTALTALIHSGLKPSQLTSLAALDSTRLQSNLAKEFGVPQSAVTGAHTYGGHGEQMAVFASQVKVDGKPLADHPGRFRNHQTPRTFLIPEPCILLSEDDRGCNGRRSVHTPCRYLCKLRQVQERDDGYAYHHRCDRRSLHSPSGHRRGDGSPRRILRTPLQNA